MPQIPSDLLAQLRDDREAIVRMLASRQAHPLLSVDLTIAQLRVLMLIASSAATTGGQLAQQLGVKPPTVSAAVDRLVEHGLVVREDSDPDRRVKHLTLTTEGNALYDELLGIRDTTEDFLNGLTADELEALARGTHALRAAVERDSPQE